MLLIELNAAKWKTGLDFYRDIFAKLGAPKWHGESVDGLIDSMIWGGINAVSPPYKIRILGVSQLPADVREEIEHLEKAVVRQRADHRRWHGKDVEVDFELVP